MDGVARFYSTLRALQAKHPGMQVMPIESSSWRWLPKGSSITWGLTVYMPLGQIGTTQGACVLAHEGEHLAAEDALTPVGFYVLYLLLLPALFTLRGWFEWRGYRAQVRAKKAAGEPITDEWISAVAMLFVSWRYAFMAPWAYWLVKRALRKIRGG